MVDVAPMNLSHNTVYKVLTPLGSSMYGGSMRWPLPADGRPGEWVHIDGPLQVCKNALHLALGAQVVNWLGPTLWIAEYEGDYLDFGPKIAARHARLLHKVSKWTEPRARMFSLGIAELVLPVFEADCPGDGRVRDALNIAHGGSRRDATAGAFYAERAAEEAPNLIAAAAARAMAEACYWGLHRSSWSHPRRTAKKVLTALGGYGMNRREAEVVLYGWLRRILRGPEPLIDGVTWDFDGRISPIDEHPVSGVGSSPERKARAPRKRPRA